MRRSLLLILFAGLALVTTGAVSLRKPQAVTYYIDSAAGNDACDGKSKKQAWKSLSRVENLSLSAGDKILLRRGSVFHEMFVINGALGSKEKPVLVSTYGKGEKPRIIAPDGSQQAVRILNCSFITVEDLDISNLGTDSEMRDRIGVNVHLQDYGEAFDTVLKGLDIHDVNGRLWKGEGAGVAIRFTMNKDSVCNWWNGIRIEGCTIRRCSRNGVTFSANHTRGNYHPHRHVVIRENLLEGVPGDGIHVVGCDSALVEYNVVRDCGDPWGGRHNASACIWPWSSDHTVIQFNEVSGSRTTWDAQGFDADYNCLGTVIRYNYSHDNDGGFLLICDDGSARKTFSAGNGGARIYGNVSWNDGIRPKPRARDRKWFSPLIHVSGPVEDCLVYQNILCRGKRSETVPEQDMRFLSSDSWGGFPISVDFRNNLFYSEEKEARFAPSGKDGVRLTGNWYEGLSEESVATACDREAKGGNDAFRQLLERTGDTRKALGKGFLREVRTATGTLTTVDRKKIDRFFGREG